MVFGMEPTAPQTPFWCESCTAPAQLQCGHCKDLFFCDKPACFEALHPRARDREMHLASVTSMSSHADPVCGDCTARHEPVGHNTTDIVEYVERQRCILRSHVADLTKQRAAAEEKCRVLEALPPQEARYKDLLLQTHVGHLLMGEDVWRSNVVCEEALARSFLTQALSAAGEVCALKTFIAKADHIIGDCLAVCLLGDDQVLRVVTESQALVRRVNIISPSGDRHRLVGAVSPFEGFSLTLPVSCVHDAVKQIALEAVLCVRVETLDLGMRLIEVRAGDTVRDVRRKVSSAAGLPDNAFDIRCGGVLMDEGYDLTCVDFRCGGIVLTQTAKHRAIAALHALGETTLTVERLEQARIRDVACLLLYAEVATAIPDEFWADTELKELTLSYEYFDLRDAPVTAIGNGVLRNCAALTNLDLSALSNVDKIGDCFLYQCSSLTEVDLSGLRKVTSIGESFLAACVSLTHLNLSALSNVLTVDNDFLSGCTALEYVDFSTWCSIAHIGDDFLYGCTSLSQLDLSGFCNITTIRDGFLDECERLESIHPLGLPKVRQVGHNFIANSNNFKPPYFPCLSTFGDGFLRATKNR